MWLLHPVIHFIHLLLHTDGGPVYGYDELKNKLVQHVKNEDVEQQSNYTHKAKL